MRRVLAFLLAMVPAAACGFPEVNYLSTDAGKDSASESSSGSSSGSGDDSSSSSSGMDAQVDSHTSGDGSSSGDSATPDGPGLDAPQDTYVVMIDAPPDSPLCDVDLDGFLGRQCPGGTDCCDTDWSAKPGQTMFFTSADMCGSFDYNCDNMIETETKVNVTCSGLATSCVGQPGFTSNPACGTMAPFYNCLPSGLGCSDQSSMTVAQACH